MTIIRIISMIAIINVINVELRRLSTTALASTTSWPGSSVLILATRGRGAAFDLFYKHASLIHTSDYDVRM